MNSEENQGLGFTEFDIMACKDTQSKRKQKKGVANKKIFGEYYVKIYEIDPYFYKNYKEKIKVVRNGREYIPFRIDVYFSEYIHKLRILMK